MTWLPSTDKSIFQVVFSGWQGLLWFFFSLSLLISRQAKQAGKPSYLLKGFANVLRERAWKVHHLSYSQMMSPHESSLQSGFLLYTRLIRVGLTTELACRVQWGNAQWGETARRVVMLFMSLGRACSRRPKFCFCKEQASTGPLPCFQLEVE